MVNPEKLATYCTQDEEKKSKDTTRYVLDIITRKQTQTTQIRHAHSQKQPEACDDNCSANQYYSNV